MWQVVAMVGEELAMNMVAAQADRTLRAFTTWRYESERTAHLERLEPVFRAAIEARERQLCVELKLVYEARALVLEQLPQLSGEARLRALQALSLLGQMRDAIDSPGAWVGLPG